MIGATRMPCLQINGEAEFFQTLPGIETAEETPARLVLTGVGHQMVFMPAAQ